MSVDECNFKPYDKVLVKNKSGNWRADFFSHVVNGHQAMTVSNLIVNFDKIISFKDNELLLGTPKDVSFSFKFGDKVMVRDNDEDAWIAAIFNRYSQKRMYPFNVYVENCKDHSYRYCKHADW